MYAGLVDSAKAWLERQGVNVSDIERATGYGRSDEASREKFRRRMDPRVRVGHWNDVIRAFRKCGPADNSETMEWAKRNLERAEKAERFVSRR